MVKVIVLIAILVVGHVFKHKLFSLVFLRPHSIKFESKRPVRYFFAVNHLLHFNGKGKVGLNKLGLFIAKLIDFRKLSQGGLLHFALLEAMNMDQEALHKAGCPKSLVIYSYKDQIISEFTKTHILDGE